MNRPDTIVQQTLQRSQAGAFLTKDEACALLRIENHSADYYALLCAANAYSRAAFAGKGVVFAQIGLDAQPCHINCKFCALSADAQQQSGVTPRIKTMEATVAEARALAAQSNGVSDLFLMTTAEFPQDLFLRYGRAVRAAIPAEMRLVANVADFDTAYALQLQDAGFTGAYHVCRLREGTDTRATPEARTHTMAAVKAAGLELYYCVEPIGPEHSPEELADEMLRIRDYPVGVMAVMKRICVPGTPLAENGEISAATLAKICAVTALTARPPRAMCVHEPDELCLMAGANQLYAECGCNPRDLTADTKNGRGFSTADAHAMLAKAEWEQ